MPTSFSGLGRYWQGAENIVTIWAKKHSTEIKLFIMVWLVYAVFVAPAGGVLPNRYQDLVFSIVNEGRFMIDTYHENTIDKAYYRGHYYLVAPPGPSFLAVPAYLVFKPLYALVPVSLKNLAGGIQSLKKEALENTNFYGQVDNVEFFLAQMFITLTVQATVSAVGSVLLYKTIVLLGFTKRRAWIVALSYAFGTMVFFFSTVFFEQVLTATVLFGSFYCLLLTRQTQDWRAGSVLIFVSGLLAGSGLLIEYQTLFISILFGLSLVFMGERRRLLLYGFGFALPVCGLMAYNYAIFETVFTTPYRYIVESQRKNHLEGFLGVGYPHVSRLIGLLFGSERGLFLYAPITIFGFVGLIHQALSQKTWRWLMVLCLVVITTYILFFSAYADWRGGASFGPRFLIPTLPFGMIGVAYALDFLHRQIIYIVAALSIAINWLGAQFGFAESPWEHIALLAAQGPTLPVFGAILSHSNSHTSMLYLLALNYHGPITLIVTCVFLIWNVWELRRVV